MDEWNDQTYQGETVAVREFLKSYGDCYDIESVRNSRQPQLVMRKIRH
jgi:hypothetical protein